METLTTIGLGSESEVVTFLQSNPLVLVLVITWILAWKGLALWKAARLSHKWWFVILLVANTVGILEIIYIYFIARKYTVEAEIVSEEK